MTSATRSQYRSVETARFEEQQLMRDLERRRLQVERRAAERAGAVGRRPEHEPLPHRLSRAVHAFIGVLREHDGVGEGATTGAAVHR